MNASSSSTTTGSNITTRPRYCYIDIDINFQRSKLAFVAAFVDATNTRYGLTSKDIRKLGGSEISRLLEFIQTDHEWSSKAVEANVTDLSAIKPPAYGSRIILELFWDVAPLACENFSKLCCHHYATRSSSSSTKAQKLHPVPIGECGKPLTYRGSNIHRVVPGFVMQGGDFVFGNGSGGESIFGGKCFKDERAGLLLRHDRRGILSMGNSGKHSNTSQFFLTFGPVPQCDTKHVSFGQVRSGFDVLRAVELVGRENTRIDESPSVSVQITECGIYEPQITPGAGYWLDLPDAQSFTGSTPVFICRPRVVLLVPADEVATKCQQVLSTHATCVAIIIVSATDNAYGTQTFSDCNNVCHKQKTTDSIVNIHDFIENMWKDSMADVFIVAPACAKSVTEIRLENRTCNTMKDDVILISKPSDCLVAIRNKSWISRMGWALDGVVP